MLQHKIYGDDMQLLEVILDDGQEVRAEVGAMVYMSETIEMNTNTGGGVFSGLKRMVSGEGFFITSFVQDSSKKIAPKTESFNPYTTPNSAGNDNSKGIVAFSAPYPGKIVPVNVGVNGMELLCQKNSFVCCESSVDISIAFTKKIGTGFFGGEGFILQKLKGTGSAFLHAGGTLIEKRLEADQTLLVDTGSLVAMTPTIQYKVTAISGIKNVLFGGEGMFLTSLTGPGNVYLQSLPFSRMAGRIIAAGRNPRKSKK